MFIDCIILAENIKVFPTQEILNKKVEIERKVWENNPQK